MQDNIAKKKKETMAQESEHWRQEKRLSGTQGQHSKKENVLAQDETSYPTQTGSKSRCEGFRKDMLDTKHHLHLIHQQLENANKEEKSSLELLHPYHESPQSLNLRTTLGEFNAYMPAKQIHQVERESSLENKMKKMQEQYLDEIARMKEKLLKAKEQCTLLKEENESFKIQAVHNEFELHANLGAAQIESNECFDQFSELKKKMESNFEKERLGLNEILCHIKEKLIRAEERCILLQEENELLKVEAVQNEFKLQTNLGLTNQLDSFEDFDQISQLKDEIESNADKYKLQQNELIHLKEKLAEVGEQCAELEEQNQLSQVEAVQNEFELHTKLGSAQLDSFEDFAQFSHLKETVESNAEKEKAQHDELASLKERLLKAEEQCVELQEQNECLKVEAVENEFDLHTKLGSAQLDSFEEITQFSKLKEEMESTSKKERLKQNELAYLKEKLLEAEQLCINLQEQNELLKAEGAQNELEWHKKLVAAQLGSHDDPKISQSKEEADNAILKLKNLESQLLTSKEAFSQLERMSIIQSQEAKSLQQIAQEQSNMQTNFLQKLEKNDQQSNEIQERVQKLSQVDEEHRMIKERSQLELKDQLKKNEFKLKEAEELLFRSNEGCDMLREQLDSLKLEGVHSEFEVQMDLGKTQVQLQEIQKQYEHLKEEIKLNAQQEKKYLKELEDELLQITRKKDNEHFRNDQHLRKSLSHSEQKEAQLCRDLKDSQDKLHETMEILQETQQKLYSFEDAMQKEMNQKTIELQKCLKDLERELFESKQELADLRKRSQHDLQNTKDQLFIAQQEAQESLHRRRQSSKELQEIKNKFELTQQEKLGRKNIASQQLMDIKKERDEYRAETGILIQRLEKLQSENMKLQTRMEQLLREMNGLKEASANLLQISVAKNAEGQASQNVDRVKEIALSMLAFVEDVTRMLAEMHEVFAEHKNEQQRMRVDMTKHLKESPQVVKNENKDTSDYEASKMCSNTCHPYVFGKCSKDDVEEELRETLRTYGIGPSTIGIPDDMYARLKSERNQR
ncbi:unnamed protein product [Calypogeia fissa]